MVLEEVGRPVGRGEHLDVESLEEGPRPELGGAELLADLVVDSRRSVARQALADAEDLVQLVVEPGAGRRSAKQGVMVREPLPHYARVCLDGPCIPTPDS